MSTPAGIFDFEISAAPIAAEAAKARLADPRAGGFVVFEGWVRNHQHGRPVLRLEYEAYAALCHKEAARILAEARERFEIVGLLCIHRTGALEIGELAVWVGATAVHRGPAFAACQYLIDELKVRLPIWKKEYYPEGDSGWVNCERCAAHVSQAHTHHHGHSH
jgi:molybdopterin synthase catalytic subunit